MIYRHGDILLYPTKNIKEIKAKKVFSGKEYVLAEGETTGHRHLLVTTKPKLEILKDNKGKMYLKTDGAKLTHQEHKTIEIQKGYYVVKHEREFDPFLEETRRVQD